MTEEAAVQLLYRWLMDAGDVPEVLWSTMLAHIERAVDDAKEGRHGRFRYNALREFRRLEERIDQALVVGSLAVQTIEVDIERDRELTQALHQEAVTAAARARRDQTLPAQLARLEKRRRAKLLGLPTSNIVLSQAWQLAAMEAYRRGEPAPLSEDFD